MKDHYDFSEGKRGPVVPIPPGKTRITIRIDDEVLDWFRDWMQLPQTTRGVFTTGADMNNAYAWYGGGGAPAKLAAGEWSKTVGQGPSRDRHEQTPAVELEERARPEYDEVVSEWRG